MEKEEKKVAEATEQKTETGAQAQPAEAAPAAAPEGENGGENGGQGEGGEQKPEPGQRDMFFERIRTNFPDNNYEEDEEGYYRDANSLLDSLVKDSKSFKDLSQKLSARLDKDPREAEVMLDWLDGTDIRVAIARHMGQEALTVPEEGSEEYEAFTKAGEDRRKELDDMKTKVDTYRSNVDASTADLDAIAEENQWSEEERADVESYIANILEKVYSGRMDKDFFNGILKARNYDKDIAGAREQGQVEGRNEKIEAEKRHHAGSGLPNAATGGSTSAEVDDPRAKKARELSFLRG